jgi:hypothetical protein
MAEIKRPASISQGVPSRVNKRTALTITMGPRVRPNSPPTIQKPMPRPRLRPDRFPAITGPTACRLAELRPTTTRKRASTA